MTRLLDDRCADAADGSARLFVFSLTNEENVWKIGGLEEVETYRLAEPLAGTQA